jgi:malonate-semialdehyde dehydrogenase (acetylating)/methylmalonate-semialdehyde dehydrogenase
MLADQVSGQSALLARHLWQNIFIARQQLMENVLSAGGENPIVVMPDADMEMSTKIIADSAFGCAGQRCAAASLAITVGEARDTFVESICDAAAQRVTGYGLDDGVQMGPVITPLSMGRIEEMIAKGISEGASIPVDGRKPQIHRYETGNFIRPTILIDVAMGGDVARTEVFGPVLKCSAC